MTTACTATRRVLGVRVAVVSDADHLVHHLDRLWAGFERDDDADIVYRIVTSPSGATLLAGDEVLAIGDRRLALDVLLWHVTRRAVESSPGVLVHAGAVERDGSAVVLPAPSGAGKSTLVAALLRRGFRYLTDEVVTFGPETAHRVRPFPRPLALEGAALGVLDGLRPDVPAAVAPWLGGGRWLLGPDEVPVGSAARPALVVAPRYEAGAALRVTPLSRAATLLELAGNAFDVAALGQDGLSLLADVASAAPGHRMVLDDLDAAADAIDELLREVAS